MVIITVDNLCEASQTDNANQCRPQLGSPALKHILIIWGRIPIQGELKFFLNLNSYQFEFSIAAYDLCPKMECLVIQNMKLLGPFVLDL